jgi:hypothetical protein
MDFDNFAKHLGFRHRKITPLWPQANVEAERFMEIMMKASVQYLSSQTPSGLT